MHIRPRTSKCLPVVNTTAPGISGFQAMAVSMKGVLLNMHKYRLGDWLGFPSTVVALIYSAILKSGEVEFQIHSYKHTPAIA